jgi:hypothetical protein
MYVNATFDKVFYFRCLLYRVSSILITNFIVFFYILFIIICIFYLNFQGNYHKIVNLFHL